MTENGLYIVNKSGIKFLEEQKTYIGIAENTKLSSRPFYLGLKDKDDSRLIYMIPMTKVDTDAKRQKIYKHINMKPNQLGASFYELTKIDGVEQAFRISDVFIVTDSMIRPWTLRSSHFVFQDQILIQNVSKKLKIMIRHYKLNPIESPNKLIQCRNFLLALNNQV